MRCKCPSQLVHGHHSTRARKRSLRGTPWEGAQVVAFEILSTLCQQHGDSLTNSAAGSIPQVDTTTVVWRQHDRVSMVWDRDERA